MRTTKTCLLILATIVLSLSIDPQLPKHVIQVFGNATLGYYYINLYVGTPPQEQSVIIDTGSGQLAMPCSKCVSCGNSHIHKPFDLRSSSSSKVLTCVPHISLRIQATSYANKDAPRQVPTHAHSWYPMRREAPSPGFWSRMRYNSKKTQREKPLPPPLGARLGRLTFSTRRQPMAFSVLLLKEKRDCLKNCTRYIASLQERNFCFRCVWPRTEDS